MPELAGNLRRPALSGGRVAVGKVTRPHGLRGDVHVLPYAENLMDLLPMEEFFLEPEGGRCLTIQEARGRASHLVVHFRDIDSLEQTRPLLQQELWAERQSFAALPPGDYYWFEIEGLAVHTVEGEFLGTVQQILATGSNDVYVVQGERGEILVPAIRGFIHAIDLEAGILTIRNLPGLLDYVD
ncbi:MAG: 16S rRNA processing protein RimM [Candidatus Tectomicrobia bacterium]|uniref:Ribosome maturation factor RimM n=1 Tax=Tectimicrobiota bacterium TaxID=2528274 RepID=A0A932LZE6_UNCTE|nr:16S rRNA processing protein RimM [Candidatus Tectomicrobia bacterium]